MKAFSEDNKRCLSVGFSFEAEQRLVLVNS